MYVKTGNINENGIGNGWEMHEYEGENVVDEARVAIRWVPAPISITPDQPCQIAEGYSRYMYACGGDSPEMAVDGKYELVSTNTIHGYPYYTYVGDGQSHSRKDELSMYWEPHSESWVITTDLVQRYGLFYTAGSHKGMSRWINDWKVAPELLYIPVWDR